MIKDEMNAEHVPCESCGGMHPRGDACDKEETIGLDHEEHNVEMFAEGGEAYDKEIDIAGSDDELDRVLDEVVRLTEDPDNEYEIESAIDSSEESPGEEHPTLERTKEIEQSPAPEEFDEVERMAHDLARDEDAKKPRTYGMNRRRI